MIAQTIGGSPERANHMRGLYEKARQQRPRCHKCSCSLAYDRAGETLPTCEQCSRAGHAHINTSGGNEKNSGVHKGPPTIPVPRLFTVRTRLDVSRTKLAKLSGSHRHTIKRIEDGAYQRARPETAKRYADALGVGLEDLQ